jgi:DNA-damage-inducible protein D
MNLQRINGQKSVFEGIKQINQDGQEFWRARDFQNILEYKEWRKFLSVIEKAKEACTNSGQKITDHFVQVDKMVSIGLRYFSGPWI